MVTTPQNTTDTGEHSRKSDHGMQRSDHLRQFGSGDSAANDGPNCPTDGSYRSKLRKNIWRESHSGKRGKNA